MGLLHIEHIKPGMILAADLRTPLGRFLLPKGSAVTEECLRSCKMWGVAAAEIEGVTRLQAERQALAAIPHDTLTLLKNHTRALFSGCDASHPAMRELARLHLQRHAMASLHGQRPGERPSHRLPAGTRHGQRPAAPPSMADLIRKGDQLFSLPAIFNKIMEVIRDPKSSAAFIAETIGKDPNLSAKLLKLVNSSYYGFPEPVGSLSRAVMIVGSSRLTSMAVGILTMTLFRKIPKRLMDVASFWRHGLACGVVARLMAARRRDMEEEPLFVAGLLHDMGRMPYAAQQPGLTAAALFEAQSRGVPSFVVESEIWGFDHAALGGAMLSAWKFPEQLIRAVAHHHQPTAANPGLEASLVHVADIIAHAMDHGGGQGFPVPPLVAEAYTATGISPDDLSSIVIQAQSQLDDITRIFIEEP